MLGKISFIIIGLALSSGVWAETRILSLDRELSGFDRLEIDAGAGNLDLRGSSGTTVLARLEFEFDPDWSEEEIDDFIAEYVRFEFNPVGDTLELIARLDEDAWRRFGGGFSFFGRRGGPAFHLEGLEVEVPGGIELEVHDGSGNADIFDIEGNVSVTDGSGNLDIENITGNLYVNDGSGNLDVRNVTGSLEIEDGSGNIEVQDIGLDARIRDGSGNIDVDRVEGDLVVRDGSGRVDTRRITGTVDIRD